MTRFVDFFTIWAILSCDLLHSFWPEICRLGKVTLAGHSIDIFWAIFAKLGRLLLQPSGHTADVEQWHAANVNAVGSNPCTRSTKVNKTDEDFQL